ncbi:hypothetical protein EC973_003465 [Apophysomyces ossiformis]|uniref:Uncharacterized protein n=1 Tax=Apophysomyces ossiformis TaxID=679940 RepID=A0A8H7BLR3_9FUNG|nr:hypothetical protein EC973_003465 [Apophysomyces ossiformis]
MGINSSCTEVPRSEDGSYTPPPPDPTLQLVLEKVDPVDYRTYCARSLNAEIHIEDCGTWQSRYTSLHERRLEQLERLKAGDFRSFQHEDRPRYVSYLCEEDEYHRPSRSCGGLADRMGGMISTFFYALLTDRAYLAHWKGKNPVALETLFEKPNIDWSYDPGKMQALFRSKRSSMLTYQQVNSINANWGALGKLLFPSGSAQNFSHLWNASYVEMKSNRGYIIRTFQESSYYPAWLAEVGLTKENAFRCFTDYLFRPTIGSRRFIDAYKSVFDMKSILSIGLQIRTDDTALANPALDNNTLAKWNYFFQCANALRDARRQPHHKHVVYFLVTDSNALRNEFVSMNYNRALAQRIVGNDTTMLVTGLPIKHLEPKVITPKFVNKPTGTKEDEYDDEAMVAGVNSAVIENWLLSYTDYRLISRKGFGKMAAFHANSARTTINLPNLENQDVAVDCANPHSFITFDTLSTWWSLG